MDAKIAWRGRSGRMEGWEGPATPDGGSHLGFGSNETEFRCPCGWRHRIETSGKVTSWGLISTAKVVA